MGNKGQPLLLLAQEIDRAEFHAQHLDDRVQDVIQRFVHVKRLGQRRGDIVDHIQAREDSFVRFPALHDMALH